MAEQSSRQYANVEIRILKQNINGYPIELTVDGTQQYIGGYLNPNDLPWVPSANSTKDGEYLFDWLMADDRLKRQWAEIRGQNAYRRIRLRIDADVPEIHAIPWELLRDTHSDHLPQTLAANNFTPFSRFIAGSWQVSSPIPQRPIKLLIAIANPNNLAEYNLNEIDVDQEKAVIHKALEDISPDLLTIEFIKEPISPLNLAKALDIGPHLFHIVAHGRFNKRNGGALLYLANDDNEVFVMKEQEFATIFSQLGRVPNLIFLACCNSAMHNPADAFRGLAPTLIKVGVPAVMAMQDRISVETVRVFTRTFYSQLLTHGQVDLATNQARSDLVNTSLPGSGIPVLFSRLLDNLLIDPLASIEHNRVRVHLTAIANKSDYRRWSDKFYIPSEGKNLPLEVSPYENDIDLQRQDLLETIRKHDRLLVLGEPGMGKTVALQRMMWETAYSNDVLIPVFVPLAFLVNDLTDLVRIALNETDKLHFDDLKSARTFLRQTRCLIMFDGFNEIPGSQREEAVRAIGNFLREFPKHRYVVTSRSQDKLWEKLRTLGIIEEAVVIQPLTQDQVKAYFFAHLGKQKGGSFYEQLDNHLRELSRIPLLLWLIKEAGLAGEGIPKNRGELFSYFVNRMLRIDEKLDLTITREVKKGVLAHLALELQMANRLAYDRKLVIDIIAEAECGFDSEVILDELLVHGLLQETQQIYFLHQSVQEHFVAVALRELIVANNKSSGWFKTNQKLSISNLMSLARDDNWSESFLQLSGLFDNPSWLAMQILKVNPWLAFWCSIEGKPLNEKTQRTIEAKTTDLLHSDSFARRLQAVNQLGKFENPRTIKYLTKALDDENVEVVIAAIKQVARFREPPTEVLLIALHRGQQARRMATWILGSIWKINELRGLAQENEFVRQEAAEVLGYLGDQRVIEPLIACLDDHSEEVRWAAARALGKLGDVRSVEPLTRFLEDHDKPEELFSQTGNTAISKPEQVLLYFAELNRESHLLFFSVSKRKFIMMSMVTFGLYDIYWFYKNWVIVRDSGAKVSPLLRTFFAHLTCYYLFKRIHLWANSYGMQSRYSPGLLTASFIIPLLFPVLMDLLWGLSLTRQSNLGLGYGIFERFYSLVPYLRILPLLALQDLINNTKKKIVSQTEPTKLSRKEVIVISIGGSVFLCFAIDFVSSIIEAF